MKKLKGYTLLEVLVVMTIMIILLGVGFSAYSSFTEITKFNQDVSNLQSDILVMQRAAMLLRRNPNENWIYGLGIDLHDINEGTYTFFKWCSPFTDFGDPLTRGRYPGSDDENPASLPIPVSSIGGNTCSGAVSNLLPLSGYGKGSLNLKGDITVSDNINYILFESVSGRVFFYENTLGEMVNSDLKINFHKNYGEDKTLNVENLTGRTKVIEYINE